MEDSAYTFRLGTYGSNNPMIASTTTNATYSNTTSTMSAILNSYSTSVSNVNYIFGSSEFPAIITDTSAYTSFTRPSGDASLTITTPTGMLSSLSTAYSVVLSCVCLVEVHPDAINRPSTQGSFTMSATYINNSTSVETTYSASYPWTKSTTDQSTHFSLTISSSVLSTATLEYVTITYNEETSTPSKDLIVTISNMYAIVTRVTSPGSTVKKYIQFTDSFGILHNIYLCPWELKHVDSISMSISGTTSTMGLPDKPASRTQIFDTSGPVRTFKITGKRYDWEETISNWDFINTELNFATDVDIGNSPDGHGYCYIGISWLFSKIQVVQKGYCFYIGNTDSTDNRFIYFVPDGSESQKGWNVAVTAMSATFSDTVPGLLEYSITLTERFKYGETLYKPYTASLGEIVT
ncbi:MAG: hypothetical protein WC936_06855 [Candidatus Nanoarchaeia archaeon]|jgi:hypothetical protein